MRNWQPTQPFDGIVFDCDSTLSAIEAIDELAVFNGVGDYVTQLTEEAMQKTGLTADLYKERLDLVRPTQAQVEEVARMYIAKQTPDIQVVVEIFQMLYKSIYVISAGVNPAVQLFAQHLNIPHTHVFAVDLEFDETGCYAGYASNSPLTRSGGKRDVILKVQEVSSNILYVGDGMNDVEVKDLVSRFVGYGGAKFRQTIADFCRYYITSKSMLPLLPLGLTHDELQSLSLDARCLYDAGLLALEEGEVLFNDF